MVTDVLDRGRSCWILVGRGRSWWLMVGCGSSYVLLDLIVDDGLKLCQEK